MIHIEAALEVPVVVPIIRGAAAPATATGVEASLQGPSTRDGLHLCLQQGLFLCGHLQGPDQDQDLQYHLHTGKRNAGDRV